MNKPYVGSSRSLASTLAGYIVTPNERDRLFRFIWPRLSSMIRRQGAIGVAGRTARKVSARWNLERYRAVEFTTKENQI